MLPNLRSMSSDPTATVRRPLHFAPRQPSAPDSRCCDLPLEITPAYPRGLGKVIHSNMRHPVRTLPPRHAQSGFHVYTQPVGIHLRDDLPCGVRSHVQIVAGPRNTAGVILVPGSHRYPWVEIRRWRQPTNPNPAMTPSVWGKVFFKVPENRSSHTGSWRQRKCLYLFLTCIFLSQRHSYRNQT